MKPLLIHIHVYYLELLPELQSIVAQAEGIPCEVWATYPESKPEFAPALTGCTQAIAVPNRGYDIAPFLHVLSKVELANYSYVLKLHTKRDMPGDAYIYPLPYNYGGDRWRKYLLNVARSGNLQRSLATFESNNMLGMVADYRLISKACETRLRDEVIRLLKKVGIPYHNSSYVMGSMFLCRTELLKPLQALGLQPSDFPLPDCNHTENLAHVIERFMGASVVAQGYAIADVFTPAIQQSSFIYWLRRLWMLLFFRKRKPDGSCIIKICKIPVYRKKRIDKRT